MKSGAIRRDGVTLASFLGDPGARSTSPEIAEAQGGLAELLERLFHLPFSSETFRHVAIVRAMLALVRPILPLARARRDHDHATAFHATETWALCPCDRCLTALGTICRQGLTPSEPLELQMQYQVAGVAMDAASAGELMKKAGSLIDTREVRDRVADELLAWALREGDPVRASIGTRVFFRLDPTGSDPGVRRLARAQLDTAVEERFTAIGRSLDDPGFATSPELPVTGGDRRDLLANDHGLLIASDRLKDALKKKVESLDFTPASIQGGKKERAWVTFSRKPRPALAMNRHGDPAILDPELVADAPLLFRVDDPGLDCYLVDRDYFAALSAAGIQPGIHAHAAPFGRSLAPRDPGSTAAS